MSCCEDRDPVYRKPMAHTSWHGHAVVVHYAGARPIEVRGASTGRVYRFSGIGREQHVDPGDAAALLRSAWFRAVRIVRAEADPNRDARIEAAASGK